MADDFDPFADFTHFSSGSQAQVTPSPASTSAPTSSQAAPSDDDPFAEFTSAFGPRKNPQYSGPTRSQDGGDAPYFDKGVLHITVRRPGAVRDDVSGKGDMDIGAAEAFGRGAVQGVTLNANADIGAALDLNSKLELINSLTQAKAIGSLDANGEKMLQQLQTEAEHPLNTLKMTRTQIQARDDAAYQQQPVATLAGNVAGAAALPTGSMEGATFAARALRGASVNSGYGAVAGFNSGDDLKSRLEQAVTGGVVGGFLGGAGHGAFGAKPPVPGVSSSALDVANATNRLGSEPLPLGVVSQSPAIHGITGVARQFPIVGEKIDTRLKSAVDTLHQKVSEKADELAMGVGTASDREGIGSAARASVERSIDVNEENAHKEFSILDQVINPKRHVPIENDADLVQTIQNIVKSRNAAGKPGIPLEGIENITELATHPEGATFEGLQRARTELAKAISWDQRNQGFYTGDLKRAYGAMTKAMEHAVRESANEIGMFTEKEAAEQFQKANDTFAEMIEKNKSLRQFLKSGSDERIVDRVLSWGSNKQGQGDIKSLIEMKNNIGRSEWSNIAGYTLQRMGLNAKGEFSPPIFLNKWASLSEAAKTHLFGPSGTGTRQFLDDIATVSTRLKDASAYENKSNTGRTVILAGTALAAIGAGQFSPMDHVKEIVGGGVLAFALSRPVTAASMARWSFMYKNFVTRPSLATKRALDSSSRYFASSIGDALGVKDRVDDIAAGLQDVVPPASASR